MTQGKLLRIFGERARSWASALNPRGLQTNDLREAFNLVYSSSRWTDQGNKSGPGSTAEACAPMGLQLSEFINAENIRSIVDVSCGGMAWWPQVLEKTDENIFFFGYDVSEAVIDENRHRFPDMVNWRFNVADARKFAYPGADLFFCRHTLNHLWQDDAIAVLRNIRSHARRFFAVTNNSLVKVNPKDSERTPLMPPRRDATCYTRMNLNISPFSLASSVHAIPDVEGESLDVFLSEHRGSTKASTKVV